MSTHSKGYRAILPTPVEQGKTPDSSEPRSAGEGSSRSSKRRRIWKGAGRSACRLCRLRKTACDGAQPRCSTCVRRATSCEYPVPEDAVARGDGACDKAFGVVDLLRTLPEDQAYELFRTLRADPVSVGFGVIRQQPLLPPPFLASFIRPPQIDAGRALTVSHPIVYPAPVSLASTTGPLLRLLEPTSLASPTLALAPPLSDPLVQHAAQKTAGEAPAFPGTALSEACLVDERLRRLEIQYWTRQDISSGFAARVISLYLENDYPVQPLFDINLFLDSLVEKKHHHCSEFLVSALLAWSCQGYSAIDRTAARLSLNFFHDAQRLWAEAEYQNTLTHVAGIQLLAMTASTYGHDDMALRWLRECVQLGTRMGLFGVHSEEESATSWLGGHYEWTRAASHTAWGIFNRMSIHCIHFRSAEILIPPLLPMPEASSSTTESHEARDSPDAGSKMQRAFPVSETFVASCRLWTIAHSMIVAYYGCSKGTLAQRASTEFSETIYSRLLSWANSLSLNLVQRDDSNHAVLLMHIYLHTIICDLFRPSVLPLVDLSVGSSMSPPSPDSSQPPPVNAESSQCSTPHSLQSTLPSLTGQTSYNASAGRLQHLLVLYRLHFKGHPTSLSVLWQTAVIYVANHNIRFVGSSTEERRFFLRLCMASLRDLYCTYRVFGSVSRGLLGKALQHRVLCAAETARELDALRKLDGLHVALDGDSGLVSNRFPGDLKGQASPSQVHNSPTVARWVLGLHLAVTDHNTVQGDNLAGSVLAAEQNDSKPGKGETVESQSECGGGQRTPAMNACEL